jgi:sulfite oxidase
VVFGGSRLRDVLADAPPELLTGARYLTARGASTPHEDDLPHFERSVPLNDVLDTALLATTLNGEPLPALHGGPLRLVLPGFYGVNNIKWLTHLSIVTEPTDNPYQAEKYRLPKRPLEPGEPFEATPENSVPSWRMRLKSLLWRPLVGETLRAGPVDLGGVAWSDGRSRVARVTVSTDLGMSWHEAALDTSKSPYAWCPWLLTLPCAPGEHEVWVRAFDDAGNAQPLEQNVGWNPAGYEWSSAERLRLSVR